MEMNRWYETETNFSILCLKEDRKLYHSLKYFHLKCLEQWRKLYYEAVASIIWKVHLYQGLKFAR